MNDIVMARTSLFRQPASQPASPPASQPARIRQSNNQFFPSENLVKHEGKNIELVTTMPQYFTGTYIKEIQVLLYVREHSRL
ncbi:hypothetical protein DPMN_073264 [Dreissena polymorpha]|uniref:Uncharacterized protein n=1 Tax=Dreissena polymorpha TaxID=45954 RepID=A0A9D4HAN9_DREPO|nr:hypothetical protein DPMN_073264 [Dreissena polymorpha]